MLHLADAAKCFGSQTIFSRFSLDLEPGQFKILVGPSGCGKSTLFDALTGVIPLDAGALTWKGKSLPHLGSQAAYMQQKDLLLPWFSLLDNSLLPTKTGRGNNGGSKEKARQLFHRLGLAGYESHYPAQVSGGMRQRCALVRTLMFQRELILLDEPLSALDAITRRGLQSLLLMLQSEFGKTILMITHDIEEALILGDEICLLSPGPMKIAQTFCPGQAKPRRFDDPKLLAAKRQMMDQLQGDLN